MSGFTPAAISEFLRERINTFERKGVVYEYGIVSRVSDGVVRVDGLSGRSYGELLEFDGGVYGMVMDLEENGVGAVLLPTEQACREVAKRALSTNCTFCHDFAPPCIFYPGDAGLARTFYR